LSTLYSDVMKPN